MARTVRKKKQKKASKASVGKRGRPQKKTAKKSAVKRHKVQAIPAGYHSITPYLIITNAAQAIDFYKNVFGAKVALRMEQPGGKVSHAELKIGDAKIMLADECPEMKARGPQAFGGSPVCIHLYIKNVDKIIDKAVSAGAKLTKPVEDMFYGDRSGMIEDPFGHVWCVSTHIEDVTTSQIKKRAAEFYGKKSM